MKKVLLSLTLFMASFFFITFEKVSAATYNYEISSDIMSVINDDFLILRDKVINHCNENNLYYIIYYNIFTQKINVITTSSSQDFYFSTKSSNVELRFNFTNYTYYDVNNNELVFKHTSATGYNDFHNSSDGQRLYLLDSNFDYIYTLSYSIDYKYKDLTYSVTSGTAFPTLYKIYLDNNPLPTDPFEEDKEILNNFYSTIFTKISDLATSFSTNYIFLLILGIFILIFVFELVWRRFI